MSSTTHCCILIITLQLICLQNYVEPKGQFVQPMMHGMQIAIPWDIANIWNRPVSLSPFLSTFLGLALLYILFFGVITSPFGYMFGVYVQNFYRLYFFLVNQFFHASFSLFLCRPSQKYVLGIGDDSFIGALVNAADQWEAVGKDTSSSDGAPASSRSFATSIVRKVIQYQWERPDFTNAVFQYTPNAIDEELTCQQLILCYAHSSLKELPIVSTPIFRVFR